MSKKSRNHRKEPSAGVEQAGNVPQGRKQTETETMDAPVEERNSGALEGEIEEPVGNSVSEVESGDSVETEPVQEETDTVSPLEAELARKDAEILSLTDRLARQVAEFKNYRRRTDDDLKRSVSRGREEVIGSFLDIFDDLKRSLDAAEKFGESNEETPEMAALHSGVKLVFQKFSDQLSRMGVEPIEAEGQPFDENHHEALMQQPAPENIVPGTVMTELQRGYKMGDRIIRHAKVIVAGNEDETA